MVNQILSSRNGHAVVVTETDMRKRFKGEPVNPIERALKRIFPDKCSVIADCTIVIVDDRQSQKISFIRLTDRLRQWLEDFYAGKAVKPIRVGIRYTDERDISNPKVFGDKKVLSRDILDYVFTLDIVA